MQQDRGRREAREGSMPQDGRGLRLDRGPKTTNGSKMRLNAGLQNLRERPEREGGEGREG